MKLNPDVDQIVIKATACRKRVRSKALDKYVGVFSESYCSYSLQRENLRLVGLPPLREHSDQIVAQKNHLLRLVTVAIAYRVSALLKAAIWR